MLHAFFQLGGGIRKWFYETPGLTVSDTASSAASSSVPSAANRGSSSASETSITDGTEYVFILAKFKLPPNTERLDSAVLGLKRQMPKRRALAAPRESRRIMKQKRC